MKHIFDFLKMKKIYFFLTLVFLFNLSPNVFSKSVTNETKKEVFTDKRALKCEKLLNVNEKDLNVFAKKGSILIDARTNEILYARNANLVAPMASTTKIMTAILAIENYRDFSKFEEVNEHTIQVIGSSMGLNKGFHVNMSGLLAGLMLNSGNDAANEIAYRVVKDMIETGKIKSTEVEIKEKDNAKVVKRYIARFVELMNEKARELGLEDTAFSSPSGLGPEDVLYSEKFKNNRTTARDLAFLASYGMKNDVFREIVASPSKAILIKRINEKTKELVEEKRICYNHNRLLKKGKETFYDKACGVKTGFTKEAGRCLVSAAKQDGLILIAVVLNDGPKDWLDCKKILEYGFSKYKTVTLPEYLDTLSKDKLPKNSKKENSENITKQKFEIIGCEGKDEFFSVVQKEPIAMAVKKDNDKNKKDNKKLNITQKIKMNPIHFSVKNGENVGEIKYFLDGNFIGETDLLAKKLN